MERDVVTYFKQQPTEKRRNLAQRSAAQRRAALSGRSVRDRLQTRWAAANLMNKKSRTVCKEWRSGPEKEWVNG